MTQVSINNAQINITGKMVLRSDLPEEEIRIFVQQTISKKYNVDRFYVSVDLYKSSEDVVWMKDGSRTFQYTIHYNIIYSSNEIN